VIARLRLLAELDDTRQAVAGADAEMARRRAEYSTPRAWRAARAALIERLKGRTPCRCGAEATICDAGPPLRWLCSTCNEAELEEMRAAARDRR
jgi:hypothetical protein